MPVNDETLKLKVPINNNLGYLRDLITKEEVENIINKIP